MNWLAQRLKRRRAIRRVIMWSDTLGDQGSDPFALIGVESDNVTTSIITAPGISQEQMIKILKSILKKLETNQVKRTEKN